jgi:restriction system protein
MRKPPSDRYIRFYGPILDVLRDLGGAAAPKEVKPAVLERVKITEAELARTLKSGQNAVENEIAWARDGLRRLGFIDGSVQGVWRLTPEGAQTHLSLEDARALRDGVYQAVRHKLQATGKDPTEVINEEADSPDSEGDLLAAIYALSPSGFEQLCKRVLREAGFYNVDVTKSGADGGIDGKGILQLNELVSFRVMFQCKRYKGSVGVDVIRNFQAALQGRADKGIILTTGFFTKEAEREASREGGMPVELVDGQRLVGLMERLRLGVLPRTVFDVDPKFFEGFR